MGNMSEEINKALLPIVHYGVDLWTCKTSGMKFIDVHAFLVDSNFELRHVLLAVSWTAVVSLSPLPSARYSKRLR